MAYDPPSWMRQFDGPLDPPSPFSYGTGEPPATWRPFADTSLWNVPISDNPTLDPNSAAQIDWLNSLGGPVDRYIGIGGTNEDYDHPWYFTSADDPLLRMKMTSGSRDPSTIWKPVGSHTAGELRASDIQNRLLPVPAESTPAGGTDQHLAIVTSTHAYEMWGAMQHDPGEGRMACRYGAVFPLDGDSTSTDGHGATAAGTSLLAGQIRLSQLEAGHINHALAIITRRVRWWEFVAPANGCATSDETVAAGSPEDMLRPVTGARLQLNYTEAEIDALPVPAWKRTILHAMREYGMIIMDTGGASWNIQFESGTADVAHGQPDRWRAFAAAQGWSQAGSGAAAPYVVPLKSGVDWTRLRVIAEP